MESPAPHGEVIDLCDSQEDILVGPELLKTCDENSPSKRRKIGPQFQETADVHNSDSQPSDPVREIKGAGFQPSAAYQETVHQYKTSIIQKYKCEMEWLSGEQELLAALYTKPLIVKGGAKKKNQNVNWNKLLNITHKVNYQRTVILRGNAGCGKSFTAQKILLDWASGQLHLDLVFYLRCEELMCLSEEMSLIEILSWSCSLTSDQISQLLQPSQKRVLFIIDGFDYLRRTQDIYDMSLHTHPYKKAPPEVIINGLLRRHIIPESILLITTKTKVIFFFKQPQCFTEILGFSEREVKEYFQKFFQDEELFRNTYKCVKANETLFTACSIPVICWIICTVIRERIKDGADVTSGLETTTSIYVDFVSTILEHHSLGLSQSVPTLLRSLGQLAERGMLEQRVLFDEKTVNETVTDPTSSPFMCRFFLKKRIHMKSMFSFLHLSFQEFFTALYYVFLDEESHRKVNELLHSVERGWALSYSSDRNILITDLQIRRSLLLQPVILFLCGLNNKGLSSSFFEKHKLYACLKTDAQLKDWIHQCSLIYHNEHMLFILHCLYELNEKSFTKEVLENLILIDLSNTPLKRTDCWVLLYCLQCCTKIRHLRLRLTSDNLKMLQSELCRCEELWLIVDQISDEVTGLISAVDKEKILNKLIVIPSKTLEATIQEISMSNKDRDVKLSVSWLRPPSELTLICPRSAVSTINWKNLQKLQSFFKPSYHDFEEEEEDEENGFLLTFLQSVSGLRKVHLQVCGRWQTHNRISRILSLILASSSLTELSMNVKDSSLLLNNEPLWKSLKQKGWTLNFWGESVLIQHTRKSFTEELKTKSESRGGESLDSVSYSTLGAESSSTGQLSSEDTVVFTPKLIHKNDEDKEKNTHRFVCPHAGQFQCSLTNLVFAMKAKGEILYNIVPWDPRLFNGLGQRKPAGPLYNINCFDGSISQLQLPHCELSAWENKDSLAVAHITGDNVEVLQPQKMTETHVTIDIRDLSLFGLIKKMIFHTSPVCAQVLLFLRPITLKQKKLNVHLLPGNVPLSEVQSQHQEKKYIETSSICHLIPGKEYSLCCSPEKCEVQPPNVVFQCNFGPNYHPTFEMFLDVNMEEVRLGLEDGTEVWKQRRVLLTGSCIKPLADRMLSESEFVDKHRDKLIQRVTSVKEIVDCLRSKDMITDEMWSEIHAADTQQKQMRILYRILDSKGSAVKAKFYRLLKEKEPDLVDELESGPSKAH